MFDPHLLAQCSNALGISGFEAPLRALIRQELAPYPNLQLQSYRSGNLIATKQHAQADAPRLMLAAHMDEIGFMVQSITPDGFLTIVPIGGWWNHTLPSQRMLVRTTHGQLIPAQVGSKPPHLLPESQRRQVLPDEALCIDLGASSEQEVRALGIAEGCPVTPDVQLQQLAIPHRWMGKAFDNRVGVYTLIKSMQQLAHEELPCTLMGAGTVQEEVGTRGARALDANLRPDIVIVLEGPPADDTMGMPSVGRMGVLGQGVQVRLYDPTNITPPELADFVRQVAQEEDIPCQWAVRRTGGTDAAASYPNWSGTPAIVLGVPVRYIHAHNGILDDRDLDAMLRLAQAIIRKATATQLAPILDPMP
ncbi:MAG: M20/M25/M40 family metallo-hydrolase [Akkermansia sp.]